MIVDIFNTNKKYNIIYADPPWKYRVWSKKGQSRSAEKHYSTMRIEDIKKLPIENISAKDCTLFLWVTMPLLYEAKEVIDGWGFTYKTVAFNWIKLNKSGKGLFFGLGYWTRANAELCLLCTKGKPTRQAKDVFQIVKTPLERHSKKPDCVRYNIVKLLGDLPRIELFARQQATGWDCWGNEVEDMKEQQVLFNV